MAPKPATIGVYIPTRNRQQLCISTLNAWSQLAADPVNIQYLIGYDEDDEESAKIIPGPGLRTHVFSKDIISCGGRNNALAGQMDVDIYMVTNDYYFPMTQYWDNQLRMIMAHGGQEVTAFTFAPNPQALHQTACTKKWMQLAGKHEPTIFPFWFSDQWRIETFCYVFNRAPITQPTLVVGAKQAGTNHMRELDFWWGLFTALRPKRMKQAYEIYKNYGLSAPTFKEFVAARRNWLDDFAMVDASKKVSFDSYEAHVGDKSEPSEKYLQCKAKAEKLIKDENLIIWKSGI